MNVIANKEDIIGVPLTKDWFIRFKFNKFELTKGIYLYEKDGVKIVTKDDVNFFFEEYKVNYVHVLQNIYKDKTKKLLSL